MTALPIQEVDRVSAHALNPFVSELWTEDTLDSAADAVRQIGHLITTNEGAPIGALYLVFEAIAAALAWEVDNIESCVLTRRAKESNHV